MGYLWATPVLGPLLLLQGRRVRKVVPRLPEPPGPRKGRVGAGTSISVLLVGDSSAAGVGAPSQDAALSGRFSEALSRYRAVDWQLLASTGATTLSTLRVLREFPASSYDVAVTVLGVNDVTSSVNATTWLDAQAALRRLLRDRFQVRHVIVCGLPPMSGFPALPQPLRWYLGSKAKRFSDLLQQATQSEHDVSFLPVDVTRDTTLMAADGFHPGPAIYAAWGERLAAEVLRLQNQES